MRKSCVVTMMVAVVLAGGWYAAGDPPGGGGNGNPHGFGKKVAGSYLVLVSQDGTPVEIPYLLTLGADGTLSAADATDFGAGVPGFGFESSQHGSWKRTGPHQITIKALWFNYDEDGALNSTGVQTSVSNFNDDFSGGSGVFTVEVFVPGQNPLDPDAVPVFSTGGTFTGQRIKA